MRRILAVVLLGTLGTAGCRPTPAMSATQLMGEFKADREAALARYRHRTVTFSGVLRKPPWEKKLVQHEGAADADALVYFVTDQPGEWLFCVVRYTKDLEALQEGDRLLVSGSVFHFESEGKLFLDHCSLKRLD